MKQQCHPLRHRGRQIKVSLMNLEATITLTPKNIEKGLSSCVMFKGGLLSKKRLSTTEPGLLCAYLNNFGKELIAELNNRSGDVPN